MSARAALGLALGLSAVVACTPRASDDWFPLVEGASQRYGVTIARGDTVRRVVWTQTLGSQGQWAGAPAWPRRHSEGVTFWLQRSAAGVRRVAVQADVDDAPIADEIPLWVLKAPYAVGTQWQNTTVPHVLWRDNEYPNDLSRSHSLPMVWRIAAVDDVLDVAAGHFAPCLRLEGQGTLRLYVDPAKGFADVPFVGREWYCRGQGLVKWSREERLQSGFFTGGQISAELLPPD